MSVAEVKGEEEEGGNQEDQSLVPVALWENSLGTYDGEKFYLRSFPIWCRTRRVPSIYHDDKRLPEAGTVDGVDFAQSMGRMELRYPLEGADKDLTEDDLLVQASSWQLEVGVKDGTKSKKINQLTGDLCRDIRRTGTWWGIEDWGDGTKTFLISMAKLDHKPWRDPWFRDSMNPKKRNQFGWTEWHEKKTVKTAEDTLMKVEPGTSENWEEDQITGISTDRLCNGIEDGEEDDHCATVLVFFDEESLELATAKVAQEELLCADIGSNTVEVYLRADGLGLLSGTLKGDIIPDQSTWEFCSKRRVPPKESGIICPAYFCPCLMIKLWKAPQSQGLWGQNFEEKQTPDFELPRERRTWSDRLQRAMTLCSPSPLLASAKTDAAVALCTGYECHQDNNKAYVTLHFQSRLEGAAARFRVDLMGFFNMKVGDNFLEVLINADAEYTCLMGHLGGNILPEKVAWELNKVDRSSQEDAPHLTVKVELPKAPGSTGLWGGEIFQKLTAYEASQMMLGRDPSTTAAIDIGGAQDGE